MLLLNVLVAVVVSVLVNRSVLTRRVEADFHEVVDAEQRQAWGDARTRSSGRRAGLATAVPRTFAAGRAKWTGN